MAGAQPGCRLAKPLLRLERREAAVTIALVAGVVYLVNFQDGQQSPTTTLALPTSCRGDELPPGWIVTEVKLAQAGSYTERGLPISFEVWVELKPAESERNSISTRVRS